MCRAKGYWCMAGEHPISTRTRWTRCPWGRQGRATIFLHQCPNLIEEEPFRLETCEGCRQLQRDDPQAFERNLAGPARDDFFDRAFEGIPPVASNHSVLSDPWVEDACQTLESHVPQMERNLMNHYVNANHQMRQERLAQHRTMQRNWRRERDEQRRNQNQG